MGQVNVELYGRIEFNPTAQELNDSCKKGGVLSVISFINVDHSTS